MRLLAVIVAVAGCTKPNPEVCCATAEQCFALGVEDLRPCDDGLTCVENRCEVASCATDGCAASAPVCDLASGACGACAVADDCARFTSTPVCSPTSGGCVACVSSTDCASPTAPVCEAEACRPCKRGDECPSGACDLDGSCVPETDALYVASSGVDAGECTRAAPCKTLSSGALPRTTPTRSHIVLLPGTVTDDDIRITAISTVASVISLHGIGATLQGPSLEFLLTATRPLRIFDIEIVYGGAALSVRDATLQDVRIRASQPLQMTGTVVARNVDIEATAGNAAIDVSSGSLTIKASRISGGSFGVVTSSTQPTTLDLENVLIFGSSREGIRAPMSSGQVSFVTVADAGLMSSGSGRGVTCSTELNISSSIVWTPSNSTSLPAIGGGCTVTSSIAGPVATPGAMNVEPLFVGAASRDYHLQAGSPAIDQVPQGPATDLDGESRPKGVMFDLGADEAF